MTRGTRVNQIAAGAQVWLWRSHKPRREGPMDLRTIAIIRSKIASQLNIVAGLAGKYQNAGVCEDLVCLDNEINLKTFHITSPNELTGRINELEIEVRMLEILYKLRNGFNMEDIDMAEKNIKKIGIVQADQASTFRCINKICTGAMEIIVSESQIQCKSCGMIFDLYGAMFRNKAHKDSSVRTTTANSKSHEYQGTFLKYYKEITGQLPCVLEEAKEQELRQLINEDTKLRPTCRDMRIYLKKCGLSKYNNRVPYFLREYTKRDLVVFTAQEYQIFQTYFIFICTIIEEIKSSLPTERSNNIQKNYIFYKIAQNFITDPEKLELIETLTQFPNQATLIKYDNVMELVCQKLAEMGLNFPYRVTPLRLAP